MDIRFVFRLLIFSAFELVLIYSIYASFSIPIWIGVFILGLSVLFRIPDIYEHKLHQHLKDNVIFVVDWFPSVLLMPIAVMLAVFNEYQWEASIMTIHWFSTLRLMNNLSKWKKENM